MIPVRLTISGFLSYQEAAELDFSGIHVACISGRNGAGKSAMLDAITWALFGEARKSDDSVINNAAPENTAKVDFEFRYEDAEYLVRRQKTKGKSTVAEFFIRAADGETWKALTEKKVADTNKRICSTLRMDYKTFINASFFLQGKADQFTGQNATERKKILSTILNLDVWEAYKARTAEKRKLAESSAQYVRGFIDEAEAELQQEEQLLSALQAAQERAAENERAYKDADEKWQLAKAGEASLKMLKENTERKQAEESRQARSVREQQTALDVRSRELQTLKAEVADAEHIEEKYASLLVVQEKLGQLSAAAAEFGRLENERTHLEAAIQTAENKLRYEHSQLSREKAELDRLLPEKQKYTDVRETESDKVKTLSAGCAALAECRQNLQKIAEQGAEKNQIIKNLKEKEKEINAKLERFLANRGGICPTCGREMDEEHTRVHSAELKEEIGAIRQEQSRMESFQASERQKYVQLKAQIQKLEEQEKELNNSRLLLSKAEQQLQMIEERLKGWEAKQKRLDELETTLLNTDFCAGEKEDLAAVRENIAALGYDRNEHEALNRQRAQLAGAEKEHQALIASRSRIEPLEREIGEKTELLNESAERLKVLHQEFEQAQADYQELKNHMPDLKVIENERNRTNQERDRANKELGQAEQRVKHLDDARSVMKARSAEYQEKLLQIRRYKDLEKAFGKDGVPALLIEQAVPEIEEQANEILQQLSNGTMSLQLNTQGSYKSKKDEIKETLEILIQDQYGVREYEMFSGGEAFRINFSIRLALSRILAQRAGSRLQTLVIDEGFGSQDEEGRARLAEAITAVQNDFEKILVITHLSELKEAFPSRIEVEKDLSGSHIEVIP